MRKIVLILSIILFSELSVFSQGYWSRKAIVPGGQRAYATGFSIGTKGYIGTGVSYTTHNYLNDLWEYNSLSNVWVQKAYFPGAARVCAVSFVIGNKAYVGLGADFNNQIYYTDFYEYNPLTNTWVQKAGFPGTARVNTVAISMNGKGYVGTGENVNLINDWWEYNPLTDTWVQKNTPPFTARTGAMAFSVNGRGYVGTGRKDLNQTEMRDLWEYNPVNDSWTQKATLPAKARACVTAISGEKYGYLISGEYTSPQNLPYYRYIQDCWRYDPLADTWTEFSCEPELKRTNSVGFRILKNLFIGTGWGETSMYNDFWKYDPMNDSVYSIRIDTALPCVITPGTYISIPYAAYGPFYGGNVFRAQLSDSSGSFTNATVIGSKSSFYNSGTINAFIPANQLPGHKYRIRVIATIPEIWGTDNGTDLVITSVLPSASVTSPVCEGDTLVFSANGGTSYSWTGPNGFSSNLQNPVIPNAMPGNSGNYTAVIDVYGCETSIPVNVMVLTSTAAITAIGSDTLVCQEDTVVLVASGGSSYQWSTGSVSSTLFVHTPGNYTVTVSGPCGTDVESYYVHQIITPDPVVTSNSPVCAGSTLNLSANGGISYSWTGPNGFASTLPNPTINHATSNASGIYTVAVNTPDCGVIMKTIAVSVITTTAGITTIGTDTLFCQDDTVALIASGGTSYLWSNGSVSPSIYVSDSGLYTVTVTNACGTDDAHIYVHNVMAPDALISSNSPVCEGGVLNLSASGGTSYSWTGPDNFNSILPNPSINNVTTDASGVYSVAVSTNDCGVKIKTINVSIISSSASITAIETDTLFCQEDTVVLVASPGTSYHWSNGYISQSISVTDSGYYSVTVTNDCGTDDAHIYVHRSIASDPVISSNSPVCEGDTLYLSANGGASYSWTGPNGFTSTLSDPSINNVSADASGAYTVAVTTHDCGIKIKTINVSISSTTAGITAIGPDTLFCQEDTVILVASGGSSYQWSTGSVSSTLFVYTPGNYTVTVSGPCGTDVESFYVHQIMTPNPVVTSNSPVCEGSTLNLSANGGISYSWTGPDNFTSILPNPSLNNVTTDASGVYSVAVLTNDCGVKIKTINVSIISSSASITTIETDTLFCQEDTVVLVASPGTSYHWSNGYISQS
ncbi:MAG TPA: kelch repeat-containing protein, partial [Bacteroidales bacterium]|nr:kelch repeat-containing protein [Bacteroidales bacterium]